jgi:putative chitinase
MMLFLNADILARCTGATIVRAQPCVDAYNAAMQAYGIADSRLRVAMLLASVGWECGGFRFTREIWNPAQVPAQAGYEGRADLGNTQPGDGFRMRGAGHLQITGRSNIAAARDRLRARWPQLNVPDFEADPDLLAMPLWAAYAACDYVDRHGCNAYADAANFDAYSDLINRGHATLAPNDHNGAAGRVALFVVALRALP